MVGIQKALVIDIPVPQAVPHRTRKSEVKTDDILTDAGDPRSKSLPMYNRNWSPKRKMPPSEDELQQSGGCRREETPDGESQGECEMAKG
jgi:hypothetical protein